MTKKKIHDTTEKPVDFTKMNIRHDFTATHFSQALYCLKKSGASRMPMENTPFIVSAMIHFYFTIESSVNCICDDIMYGDKSMFYIKPENRSVELKKYFSNWKNMPLEEKLNFLIERFDAHEITKDFVEEIKEFGRLRNLIVHNKVYRPQYSQADPEENPRIWEVEYETEAGKLFPKTKFSLPFELNVADVLKALAICLRLLIVFADRCYFPIFYHLPSGDARTMGYIDKDKTVDDHVKEILDKLQKTDLL